MEYSRRVAQQSALPCDDRRMSYDSSAPLARLAEAALVALAARRLVTIAVDDEIARPLREKLWERFPPETSKLGYASACRKCSAVWASVIAIGLAAAARGESRRSSLAGLAVGTLVVSECVGWLDALHGRAEKPSMLD